MLEGVGTLDAAFNAFAERGQLRLVEFVVNLLGNARHARFSPTSRIKHAVRKFLVGTFKLSNAPADFNRSFARADISLADLNRYAKMLAYICVLP